MGGFKQFVRPTVEKADKIFFGVGLYILVQDEMNRDFLNECRNSIIQRMWVLFPT